jgi:hypothetical protein
MGRWHISSGGARDRELEYGVLKGAWQPKANRAWHPFHCTSH